MIGYRFCPPKRLPFPHPHVSQQNLKPIARRTGRQNESVIRAFGQGDRDFDLFPTESVTLTRYFRLVWGEVQSMKKEGEVTKAERKLNHELVTKMTLAVGTCDRTFFGKGRPHPNLGSGPKLAQRFKLILQKRYAQFPSSLIWPCHHPKL